MTDAIDRAQGLDQCKTAMTPDRFLEEGGAFARQYKECVDNNVRFAGASDEEAKEYCKSDYEQGKQQYCEKQLQLNRNVETTRPAPTPPPADDDALYIQRREEAKSQETQASASEETLNKKQEELDAQKQASSIPATTPPTPPVIPTNTASAQKIVEVPSILAQVNGMEISCTSRHAGARPALNAARKCMMDEGKKLGYIPTSQPFDYTSELKEQVVAYSDTAENYYWEVKGIGMFKKATPEDAAPTTECQQLRDLQEEITVLEKNLIKLETEKKDLDAQATTNPQFAKIAREINQNLDPDATTTEERNFKFDYFDITRQINSLKGAGNFSIQKKKQQAEELKPRCNQSVVTASTGSSTPTPTSTNSSTPSVLYKVEEVGDILTPEELAQYGLPPSMNTFNARILTTTWNSNGKISYDVKYPSEATNKQEAIALITQKIKTEGIAKSPPQPNFVYPGTLEPRPERPLTPTQVVQPAGNAPCTELEQVNTLLEEVKKVRNDATDKREAIEDADATETRKTEYDQLRAIEQRETNKIIGLMNRKRILEAECKQEPPPPKPTTPQPELTPAQRYDKTLTDTITNTGVPIEPDVISVENNTITTSAIRSRGTTAASQAADNLNIREAFRRNFDESKPKDKTVNNEVISSPTSQNPNRVVYKTTVKATYDAKTTAPPPKEQSTVVETTAVTPAPAVAPQKEQPPMSNEKMEQRQQVAETRKDVQGERTSATQTNNTRAAKTNSYPLKYTPGPTDKR